MFDSWWLQNGVSLTNRLLTLAVIFKRRPARQYLYKLKRAVMHMPLLHITAGGFAIGPNNVRDIVACLLYTSPSPRDQRGSRMPSSA